MTAGEFRAELERRLRALGELEVGELVQAVIASGGYVARNLAERPHPTG